MAAVTVAISAERLAPAPLRVERVTGVAILVVGLLRSRGSSGSSVE